MATEMGGMPPVGPIGQAAMPVVAPGIDLPPSASIPPAYTPDSLSGAAGPRGAFPASAVSLAQAPAPVTQVAPAAPVAPAPKPKGLWENIKQTVSPPGGTSVLTKMLCGVAGFLLFAGMFAALLGTGGMAAAVVAVAYGALGFVAGVMVAGGFGPVMGGQAAPEQAPPPAPEAQVPQQQPIAPPAPVDPAAQARYSWLSQVDALIAAGQAARERNEAADLHRRLTEQLYNLSIAMQQSIADANRQQEYGEFSRRYVLSNTVREQLQQRFALPPSP